MSPDLQLDYWNRIGPTKTFSHPLNLQQLSRWVDPTSRILDYGCGYGRTLGFLNANGYTNLVGVDPAPAMIEAARRTLPDISLSVLNDFRNVGLAAASVDAVLLLAVLTCIPSNEGQGSVLAEVSRVLRPGGLLYISDMWLQTDPRNIARYVEGEVKYGVYGVFDLSEGVTVRHHDRKWIEELTAGYELLALDAIEVQTMNGNPSDAFQWFGRLQESSPLSMSS